MKITKVYLLSTNRYLSFAARVIANAVPVLNIKKCIFFLQVDLVFFLELYRRLLFADRVNANAILYISAFTLTFIHVICCIYMKITKVYLLLSTSRPCLFYK